MRNSLARFLCTTLGAVLLLAGCSGQEEPRSFLMAAPPSEVGTAGWERAAQWEDGIAVPDPAAEDTAMDLATVTSALSGSYAGNESGCYTLATYSDGSADVLYFDYAAQAMAMLEQPEKPDETYQGRVAGCWAGPPFYRHSGHRIRLIR